MRRTIAFLILAACLYVAAVTRGQETPSAFTLPLKPKSVKFAVIGDSGSGDKFQYAVAAQMEKSRKSFPFEFVVMLGDNIYGRQGASGLKAKFEAPYKHLLDDGVKFYASLGNHDDPNERFYKPFNMDGKRYYSFKNGDVQMFALDSNYMDSEQLSWIDQQLSGSHAAWKICFFHHPLYSHARFHGSDVDLRSKLEPLFARNGVNVVLAGHEHVYERLKPQGGIYYFVLGNAGELRFHDLAPSPDTAKGYDTGRSFMMIEIAGDELYFQTIAENGETVTPGC